MTAVRHDVHHVISAQIIQPGCTRLDRDLPFVYDINQPYEVTVLVAGHGGVLRRFVVGRAELDSGRYKLVRRPGADAAAYPDAHDRRRMYIWVNPGCRHSATLMVATVDVSNLLDAIYDLVPPGREADFQAVPDPAAYDSWLAGLAGAA